MKKLGVNADEKDEKKVSINKTIQKNPSVKLIEPEKHQNISFEKKN